MSNNIFWASLDAQLTSKGWPSIFGDSLPKAIFFYCDPNDNQKITDFSYNNMNILSVIYSKKRLEQEGKLYMCLYRFNGCNDYVIEGPNIEIPQRPPGISD
jgi:hypothetical protein